MSGALAAVVLALAAAATPAHPSPPSLDESYRSALERLYAGSTDAAITAFESIEAEHPEDPLGLYFHALALCWKVEQRPETTALDAGLQEDVDRVLAVTEARLRARPEDTRARLARGGAFGVRSRLFLFRLKGRDAARAAVAMRTELLAIPPSAPEYSDARFGLGLYDYYVDVLPRFAKLLRFLSGLPGGDRERGLAAIEEAAHRSRYHRVEARAQLYEIYAYYEKKPDRALDEIRGLRDRYPATPLWALKLTDHLSERLGRYGDGASVARAIVAAADRGEPNFGPVARALGQLALGRALLLDLRLAEARAALSAARAGLPPLQAARARLWLGRALELSGDRETAAVHYQAAALARDKDVRRSAQEALDKPLSSKRVRAAVLLAQARRLRESGDLGASAAVYEDVLGIDSDNLEARLRVAERRLDEGRPSSVAAWIRKIADDDDPQPPWLHPWSRLLAARLDDLAGNRVPAVILYKEVLAEPYGDLELRHAAEVGLRRPFAVAQRAAPPAEP